MQKIIFYGGVVMAVFDVIWKAKWIWDAFNQQTANIYLGLMKDFYINNKNGKL